MGSLLVAFAAVVALPFTVWVVLRGQHQTYQLMLEHLEDAARVGEPKEITAERLDLERKKLDLQHLMQQEIMQRKAQRSLVDMSA